MLYVKIETDTVSILGWLVQVKSDDTGCSVTVGTTTIECKDILSFETDSHRMSWGYDSRSGDPNGCERFRSILEALCP